MMVVQAGKSLLHVCAEKGFARSAGMLIDAGADTDALSPVRHLHLITAAAHVEAILMVVGSHHCRTRLLCTMLLALCADRVRR